MKKSYDSLTVKIENFANFRSRENLRQNCIHVADEDTTSKWIKKIFQLTTEN